jgi:ubiquinone/menaquinone biosynthesis C-methylase UbiE
VWFDNRLENNKLTIYCMNWGFDNNAVDINTVEKLYSNSTSVLVEKYSLQLYYEVTKDIDFSGKTYLDISSGKGGGVNFLTHVKSPLKSFGLDFCSSNVNFCKNKFDNITFIQGDAANLPFKDNEMDIITNVEASHCYPNLDKFFSEVHRCLNVNGYFAYTDFGTPEKYERVRKLIVEKGFKVIIDKNISNFVVKSMEATTSEKKKLINHYGSKFIAPILNRFTSTKNSTTYNKFQDGRYVYFYMLCSK